MSGKTWYEIGPLCRECESLLTPGESEEFGGICMGCADGVPVEQQRPDLPLEELADLSRELCAHHGFVSSPCPQCARMKN